MFDPERKLSALDRSSERDPLELDTVLVELARLLSHKMQPSCKYPFEGYTCRRQPHVTAHPALG